MCISLWTSTTTNTPSPDTTHNCLNLLTRTQTVYSSTGTGSPSVTRTKGFTPDATHCRYTQIVTESPGTQYSSNYMVTEDLGYDPTSNVLISDAVTGIGMPTRTTYIAWNPTGQFPRTVTNALNQITQLTFDPTWGTPTSVIDPNTISMQREYDGFGRIHKETRPDGASTQWAYSDCSSNGGCLIGSHALVSTHTDYNSDGSPLADGTDYFDPVDRPLVSTRRLLANYQRNERRYDSLGNVSWQAAPCTWSVITAACPSGTTFTHDVLNRTTIAQRTNAPAAFYAYGGRTHVATDPNGHAKTTVSDVNGWLRQTQDANNYAVTITYDAAGGKIGTTDNQSRTLWSGTVQYGIAPFTVQSNDLAMGAHTYTFDALGELTGWTDPRFTNPGVFSVTYDALSRPTSRSEPDLFTQWTWGTSAALYEIGKLSSVCTGTGISPAACDPSGYSESEAYDSAGRLSQRSITIPNSGAFTYGYQYNTSGLLSTLTYPATTFGNPLQLQYGYSNGILQSISDVSDPLPNNVTVWMANAINPAGQMTQETLGNSVQINRSFDAVAQWLNSITAGVSGGAGLENQSYLHDPVGNVTQRQENNLGLTESFYYDNLNRLYNSTLTSPQSGTSTNLQMCYDNAAGGCSENLSGPGSITSKTTDETAPGSYTANWTSYNYPASIVGAESVQFSYGPDRQRWQQNYNNGAEVTNYIGGLLEEVVSTSGTDYRHYVYAGNEPVAVQSRTAAGNTWTYVLSDQQGGVAAFASSSGTVDVNESFTAYGARRDPSTWAATPSSGDLTTIAGLSREGYTFRTALGQSTGFNHMNGRVQDAVTGQFLSPDPNIPDPTNTQGYNRYTYVENNPLTYQDPSGFVFRCTTTTTLIYPNISSDNSDATADGLEGGVRCPWYRNSDGRTHDQLLRGRHLSSIVFSRGIRAEHSAHHIVAAANNTFGSDGSGSAPFARTASR